MASTTNNPSRQAVLLGLLSALLLVLVSVELQAREVSRSIGLRQDVFEQMQEIQELTEQGELQTALARLKKMQAGKLSDYELAQTWFLSGYVFYRQEQYPQALRAYSRVLDSENIPPGMQQNVLHTLSQLSMVMEEYDKALGYVEQLLQVSEEPVPDYYVLKAQVLFQLEKYRQSMAMLDRAMALQAERGKPPRENWLLLKNAVLYTRNDYKGMLQVLRQLVTLYPRERYLLNMAAIYGELDQSEKQLSLMEPLYERGSLTNPSQLVNLASLYIMHDIPYKGAALLDKEIQAKTLAANKQHLDLLAQAWLLALEYERAIGPLRRAAKLADDGEPYLRLANTYMSLSRWQEAEDSVLAALKKGGLRDKGGAHLLLGMARFNQKDYRKARRAFADAGKHPGTEQLSRQWLEYLTSEEEKAVALQDL